jgi:hypothetical protein
LMLRGFHGAGVSDVTGTSVVGEICWATSPPNRKRRPILGIGARRRSQTLVLVLV